MLGMKWSTTTKVPVQRTQNKPLLPKATNDAQQNTSDVVPLQWPVYWRMDTILCSHAACQLQPML